MYKVSVTQQLNQLDVGKERLEALMTLVHSFLKSLEDVLPQAGEPKVLYEAARWLLGRGKMLRSILILLVSEAYGGDREKAKKLAVGVELIHTASLIHDDILDDAEIRRGISSVHKKYGVHTAIVAGDLLISKAVETIAGLDPGIIKLCSDAARRMSEGENLEMGLKGKEISLTEYFEIAERKTASPVEAAAEAAAIISGASEREAAAFREYGRLVGLSLQIRDDILDVIGLEESVGKPLRMDHHRGYANIVHILSRLRGHELGNPVGDIKSVEEAQRIGRRFSVEAVEALSFLDDDVRKPFEEIAKLIINRMA